MYAEEIQRVNTEVQSRVQGFADYTEFTLPVIIFCSR